jgi:hypothetical protein
MPSGPSCRLVRPPPRSCTTSGGVLGALRRIQLGHRRPLRSPALQCEMAEITAAITSRGLRGRLILVTFIQASFPGGPAPVRAPDTLRRSPAPADLHVDGSWISPCLGTPSDAPRELVRCRVTFALSESSSGTQMRVSVGLLHFQGGSAAGWRHRIVEAGSDVSFGRRPRGGVPRGGAPSVAPSAQTPAWPVQVAAAAEMLSRAALPSCESAFAGHVGKLRSGFMADS